MSEDVANHTLAILRRLDQKVDGVTSELGGLRGDVRLVLDRMTSLEKAMLAMDEAAVYRQDQIDHLRHRVEALEDHLGRPFRTPSPAA